MSSNVEVIMYRTHFCIYCVMAERLLKSKQIDFEQIDVSGQPTMRQELRERTGRRTVPQIFIAGQSVGGYDDIAALDRQGRLEPMLGIS